jgi:hypothetical protein
MAWRNFLFPKGTKNPKAAPGRAAVQDSSPPSIQPVAERFPALEEQEVVLTTLAPEAREVNVAGNFNNWHPEATPMKNTGEGNWAVRLMLRAGQYEYHRVIRFRFALALVLTVWEFGRANGRERPMKRITCGPTKKGYRESRHQE